jgi:ribosomal-protein-alanine acetyltransferase
MFLIRRGEPADLPAIEAIQQASPEAAQWNVADYLAHDFRVAEDGGRLAGFVVARLVAADESEILTIAVAPEHRRRGVARRLLMALLEGFFGNVYLEVRESNSAARGFYKTIGFQEVNTRYHYYLAPPEAAIVMKFHSC